MIVPPSEVKRLDLAESVAVFSGGCLGGGLRYLAGLIVPFSATAATLMINLVGAFLLALILTRWMRGAREPALWRAFLATGLLGSFTTWSTFMANTAVLGRDHNVGVAAGFSAGAVVAGLVAACAGGWLGMRVAGDGS